MVGVGPDDEVSRRRLPSWMVGQGRQESVNEASSSLVKSEAKRKRTTISSRQDTEIVTEKKRVNGARRKVRESTPRKKVKAKSFGSKSNDDGELSVEDLLSIAKEYVEADRDFESEKQLTTANCFENEARSSHDASKSVNKSPSLPTTAVCDSTMNMTSEESVLFTSGTGDPAKDMLNLFLGPLLKKPADEERKNTGFATTDEGFSYEFRRRSQNDVAEEKLPRTKTKSSLKDKVAILLD